MTMQIRDVFILDNQPYLLWLWGGEGFFDPEEHGVEPSFLNTACYRGFYSTYHLQNNYLELLQLIAGYELEDMPKFNGIEPQQFGHGEGGLDVVGYANVGLEIPFSGGLVIARERVGSRLGIGPELLWRFNHVRELVFENGHLISLFDRSQAMAELRERFLREEATPELTFPEVRTPEIMEARSQNVQGFYWQMEIEIDRCLELDYHKRDSS